MNALGCSVIKATRTVEKPIIKARVHLGAIKGWSPSLKDRGPQVFFYFLLVAGPFEGDANEFAINHV